MASLFKVKALYDFEAKEEDDLGFPGGQIIDVTEEVDDNWLEGKYTDASGAAHSGIFPREFVEKYEPPTPARPTRPARKQEAPAPGAAREPEPALKPAEESAAEDEDDEPPAVPVTSKPQAAPPVAQDEPSTISPTASTEVPEVASAAPPAARQVPPEPAGASPAAKKPPPVAAKSNAFKDRIAAFNQSAAQPVVPILPGKARTNDFIKKPFVAPPPSSHAYVPTAPKVEPNAKPYIREEDPEIIRKQEEDQAAAEAAGLAGDSQQAGEDAPKPVSLRERIALLQQQQLEQAQRAVKKEKKPAPKKVVEPTEDAEEEEAADGEPTRSRSIGSKQSMDTPRERPRIPSSQRPTAEPLSPLPVPEHDIVSDGNDADQSAAGETTEDETGTIGPESGSDPAPLPRAPDAPKQEPDVGDEEDTTEAPEEEDEEDEIDEETRRKMELRERMAKLSGGGIMPGMNPLAGFAPRGLPPKKPTKKASEDSATSPSLPPQRMPMIPVPGLQPVPIPKQEESDEDDEEEASAPQSARQPTTEDRAAPPVPKDSRPAPPVPSLEERTVPPGPAAAAARPAPPPPQPVLSPGPGSESDDEASGAAASGLETPGPLPETRAAPPIPTSPPAIPSRTSTYMSSASEVPTPTAEKMASRAPPPIPQSPALASRPPPPPPPGALSQQATDASGDDEDEGGESDYEGDYDTDIASGAKHKEALKSHLRESSIDDGSTLADEPLSPPPVPIASAPRAVPPPPPPGQARKSMEVTRPPPPPPARDEEYDPYRAEAIRSPPPLPPAAVAPPPVPQRDLESSADETYAAAKSPTESRPPPLPPHAAPPPEPLLSPPTERPSMDARRTLTAVSMASNATVSQRSKASLDVRRSIEQQRASGDHSSMATDIPLNEESVWWTASNPLPPVLQARRNVDILTENEESTATKRGGQSVVTKNIFVLFPDYSETSISAKYNARDPSQCELQQDHKPAPARLRQDQLEAYWQRFGRALAEKTSTLAHAKKDASIPGDGTPASFVAELIRAHADALQPVGTKSYGALVYENMGNATTQQFDEIRPGDIVTLRGARFEGTHGAMKSKYRQDFSAGHVAVVEEWDGTKRAIRIWEHGREVDGKKDKKGGVKSDKLRLGDLKSGEVRVWRVVGRDYVGW